MEAKFNELLSFTKTNFLENYLLYLNVLKVILLVAFIFYSLFKKNNNLILNWNKIKQDFELLINKYKNLLKSEKNIDEDSPIWVMWYQGIENAPPIVLSCIQSIIRNRAKHKVIIISKYNLENYIKLPKHIIEKFNNNIFSITHLSDIVRFALLQKYGGYWIDATYLVTTPLEKINSPFYTLKLNYCWTYNHPFINCLWSANFFALPKNSFVATFGYKALLNYWKKYNLLIDYFLIDYIIYIAYHKEEKFKTIINKHPFTTCNIFSLVESLNNNYNPRDFQCSFNKLTKNGNWIISNDKGSTNYGYIIKKYKFKFKNENKSFFLT